MTTLLLLPLPAMLEYKGMSLTPSFFTPELLRNSRVYVECGTGHHLGSVPLALESPQLEKIYTIERDSVLASSAMKLAQPYSRVSTYCGASSTILPQILKLIDCPATFFLDDHCIPRPKIVNGLAEIDFLLQDDHCDLQEDVELIVAHAKAHKLPHNIWIDDLRIFTHNPIEFGLSNDISYPPLFDLPRSLSYCLRPLAGTHYQIVKRDSLNAKADVVCISLNF